MVSVQILRTGISEKQAHFKGNKAWMQGLGLRLAEGEDMTSEILVLTEKHRVIYHEEEKRVSVEFFSVTKDQMGEGHWNTLIHRCQKDEEYIDLLGKELYDFKGLCATYLHDSIEDAIEKSNLKSDLECYKKLFEKEKQEHEELKKRTVDAQSQQYYLDTISSLQAENQRIKKKTNTLLEDNGDLKHDLDHAYKSLERLGKETDKLKADKDRIVKENLQLVSQVKSEQHGSVVEASIARPE